jgi:hypothetical protein
LSVIPDDALELLLRRLEHETNADVQNSLAYACWWIVNGWTFLVQENKAIGCLFAPIDRRLEEVLASAELSLYARETLNECKSR